MPQLILPMFPHGVTHITGDLAVACEGERVAYFHGALPVFTHERGDVATFRMITSQFVVNGNCQQRDIVRTFGVPSVTVKRAVKRYRDGGPGAFYQPRTARGAAVLTAEVMERLQALLDSGEGVNAAARELGVKPNTAHKAVRAGRLRVPSKKKRRAI
jgi:transposase-like protein